MTLEALANAIGTTRQTIARWERGEGVEITLNMLLKLCNLFDCELGYLLCEFDCKTRLKTDIQEETGLIEPAVKSLISDKSPYFITLLNELLTCPTEIVDEIGKRFIIYLHVKRSVIPKANELGIKETEFLPDIKINGILLPRVPLKDLEEYARFELYRAFMNFGEVDRRNQDAKK